ncbi:MAG: hypothetical protein M1286_03325 [Candidatus Marsarchaeota archaeon]|nr:hypothetical protein [Candidatus Marsarchaeota archaeon]
MARGRNAAQHATTSKILVVVGILIAYSFFATVGLLTLNGQLAAPGVINPLIKFSVGSPSYANTTNLKRVPLNQTFCPENATIQKVSAGYNAYLYYTNVTPGQVFRYSLIYNTSIGEFASATVLPPFKLVSYSNAIQSRMDCLGYPDAHGNATVMIQAPNSSYFGPIYAFLYFNRR